MEDRVLSAMVELGTAIDTLAIQPTHDQCKEVNALSRSLLSILLSACQDFGPYDDAEVLEHAPGLFRRGARVIDGYGHSTDSNELKEDAINTRRWGELAKCLQEGNREKFQQIIDGTLEECTHQENKNTLVEVF